MDKRLQNLKPIQKGEIRNPKGRGKGTLNNDTIFKRFASIIEKAENSLTGEIEELTQAEQVVISHIVKAKNGDMQAIDKFYERLYGKVPERIIDETPPKKLVIIVTDDDIDET